MELPGVRMAADWPVVSALFSALLPSLVLRIFLAVLPFLLEYMGHVEGLTCLSSVQFSVIKKYFAFQVLLHLLSSRKAQSLVQSSDFCGVMASKLLSNRSSSIDMTDPSGSAAGSKTDRFFIPRN